MACFVLNSVIHSIRHPCLLAGSTFEFIATITQDLLMSLVRAFVASLPGRRVGLHLPRIDRTFARANEARARARQRPTVFDFFLKVDSSDSHGSEEKPLFQRFHSTPRAKDAPQQRTKEQQNNDEVGTSLSSRVPPPFPSPPSDASVLLSGHFL